MAVGNGGNALLPVSSLPDPARKFLSYEAADPQFYAPEKGFDALAPLVVRPGETAKVELTLYGPTGECTLDVGGAKTRLPAIEKETHRKFTLDGEYRGVCPVTVTPENRNDPFEGRFEFVKRYR
jgi:hypothetical protein